MSLIAPVLGLSVLLVVGFLGWSAVRIVDDGDVRLLVVSDDPRAILRPGLHFVPPLISTTYRANLERGVYETPDGQKEIPSELLDPVGGDEDDEDDETEWRY